MSASAKVRVGIFTFRDDLHAHLVAQHIRELGHVCHHIATDRLAHSASLSWCVDGARIQDVEGRSIDPATLATVWWRRVMGGQTLEHEVDAEARSLISVECRTALAGMVLSGFQGRWVNDPAAEVRADNKLVQLQTARKMGFRTPRTLVSAHAGDIRTFVHSLQKRAVVKVVRGLAEFSIPARLVTDDDLYDDAGLEACPAMYQEAIEGTAHLRIHVFGSGVTAVRIDAEQLDWRPHLDSPMRPFELPETFASACIALTRKLGLAMGIIDAKLDRDGTPVFLEINPQGQFLFMEGLTGLPLARRMAHFLCA